MVPNSQLQYFLAAQTNRGNLRLSWPEQVVAALVSSQSYPNNATQSELLEQHHRTVGFQPMRGQIGRKIALALTAGLAYLQTRLYN